MGSNIIWFEQVGKDDVELVGGKGANLGELTNAGIPVPPGFVVPAPVYHEFIESTGLATVIAQYLDGLDVDDLADVELRAQAIRDAIMYVGMPGSVEADIKAAYGHLSQGQDLLVAVRSSATAEDLPDASFAGQQDTYLNMRGMDDVVRCVQSCWASLWNARAICYRVEQGFDHLSVSLAAVVQVMVQADVAGVAFTVDPTGDPSTMIFNAVWGLGEAAVSGEVNADTYRVNRETGEIIQILVEPQGAMLALDPSGAGSTWQPVPEDYVKVAKLSGQQIAELAQIVMRVEDHYGSPQDIEWAMWGGRFCILQARPITTVISTQGDEPEIPQGLPQPRALGQNASPGVATGKTVVLGGPEDCYLVDYGDVMVIPTTNPDCVPAMKRAAGIVTNCGGVLSHAAIIARELGIPCVVGTHNATTTLQPGQIVTVDGSHGWVFDGKVPELVQWNEQRLAQAAAQEAAMATVQTNTKVYAIVADPDEAAKVAAGNVDGVGLLRMEFVLAQIGKHPRQFLAEGAGEQYTQRLVDAFMAFCRAFGDRPVVLRLMDFKSNELAGLEGGSKFEPSEENPMLGLRGVARYMLYPEVFALELEAIRRVREAHKNLHVMIPFVRTVNELRWTLDFMAEHGLQRGPDFKVWMMAEVPSNVFLIEEFIACGLDGISIGSNDLTQLILGLDRDGERVAHVGNELNPAVMIAMEHLVRTGIKCGITVGICGQAPSNHPELAAKLVEWGATSISVMPDSISRTRKSVLQAEQQLQD